MKKEIWLEDLSRDIPVILPNAVGFYVQNTMICFDRNNHRSGVSLAVSFGEVEMAVEVHWKGAVTPDLRNAYNDIGKMVDFGACTIALLLIRDLTEYTAVRQSATGTTIDYYLQPKTSDELYIFENAVYLEVSGILTEASSNTINKRIKDKVKRLQQQPGDKTFIVVVEFGKPKAVVESHD